MTSRARFRRPPVMVSLPVSSTVTLHCSTQPRTRVTPPNARSIRNAQVNGGQPVAVGEQEALAADDIACPLQASAGHGVVAGVEHRDLPLLDAAAHAGHLAGRQIDPEVAVQACVVEKIELDDLRLVAGEHDELVEAVVGVDLHDVPDDGTAADLHHGLGPHDGLLGQPAAVAAGEDHHLHEVAAPADSRSEEHTSELQSLMRISYAVFCLIKKKTNNT